MTKKIKDLQTALKMFEEAALDHSIATKSGDYKTGNRNYSIINKAKSFLKEINQLHELSVFLYHENDGVKVWAASILINVNHPAARNVLENISKTQGMQGLIAEMTLSEWDKGNLRE